MNQTDWSFHIFEDLFSGKHLFGVETFSLNFSRYRKEENQISMHLSFADGQRQDFFIYLSVNSVSFSIKKNKFFKKNFDFCLPTL